MEALKKAEFDKLLKFAQKSVLSPCLPLAGTDGTMIIRGILILYWLASYAFLLIIILLSVQDPWRQQQGHAGADPSLSSILLGGRLLEILHFPFL